MKKLIIAIFMLIGTISMVSAELGVKVGVSAQLGELEAKGTEKSTDTARGSASKTAKGLFAAGTYFIEKDLSFLPGPFGRLSIGYDNIAHDINLGSATNVRKGDLTSKAQGQLGVGQTHYNEARASIDGFETVYATFNITDWLFVKAGNVTMDVTTKENLDAGGSYDNVSLDGSVVAIGYHNQWDSGMFLRVEYNDVNIDGATLNNKGTDTKRSIILGDVSGNTTKISIGKAF